MNCSCHICEPKEEDANKAKAGKEDEKKGSNAIQGASSGEVTRVWVGTGAKVAPQQVANRNDFSDHTELDPPYQALRKDKEGTATVETSKVKEERPVVAGRCWKKIWLGALKKTGELFICFRQKVPNREICIFRDLDPAYHHPSCHGGLRHRCHYLVHQGQLISIHLHVIFHMTQSQML